MKLDTLTLENFRQFRDGSIEFSTDPDKNITVIHGQNGAGKTTLLNAFLWAFYEDLQSVKRPDRLANQGEMAAVNVGESVSVSVELTFEHEDSYHRVRREHAYRKTDDDDLAGERIESSFTVEYEQEDGSLTTPKNPDAYIRQIVPKDLAGLFFFDGEYISDLSGIDNQGEIQDAIRQMMGLTIMDRAIRHLDTVEHNFRDDLQKYASDDLKELIQRRNELDEKIQSLEQKQDDKKKEKARLREEVSDINRVLDGLDETQELSQTRSEKEDEKKQKQAEISEINQQIEQEVSKHGFLPFILPAIRETAEDIDELREQGKIPSELDNEFVEELLTDGHCICERPLVEDSDPYEAVSGYKTDVSASGLDQAAIQYISRLSHVNENHDQFFETVEGLVDERKGIEEEIQNLTEEIDNLSTKIQDLTDEAGLTGLEEEVQGLSIDAQTSPSDLESARSEKKEQIKELERRIGGLDTEIDNKKEELADLEDEISEAREEAHEAEVAKYRMHAARSVKEELESYYKRFQDTVRRRANNRVDDTFSKVATKNYEAQITDEFKLRVVDSEYKNPIDVDKSRGERQIASLSFIGSLVDVAREQYEEKDDAEYFTGGIYPIVMDSPFGALDSDHRRDVSLILPELADQVTVLVTDTQWDGTVEEAMSDRIGCEYVLEFDENGGPDDMPVTEIAERGLEVTH